MSARAAWIAWALIACALFWPVLLRGEVIFAHDNALEVSAPPVESDRLATRYFNDQSSAYVPEVHVQLAGKRSSWISTWNPHVELGRPTGQLSGFGKAFLPMHLLSFVTHDALRMTTALSLLAVAAAGAFGMLFLRSLGLAPAACLAGAVGLSLGVFPSFWLTFPMFVWGIAWTLAVLWLVVVLVRRPTFGAWLGLAFCVHALLLSAYPQQVVWHAWIACPFALARIARRPGSGRAKLGALLALGSAALVGALSVLPVFADLALDSARSGRSELEPGYFLASIPRVASAADLWRAWAQTIDPFLWGNPLAEDAPFDVNLFKGAAWSPLFAGLIACSARGGLWRRAWGWQLVLAVALLLTFWPDAYLLAVRHVGLSLSRFPPLGGAWIPAMTLAALSADALLARARVPDHRSSADSIAACLERAPVPDRPSLADAALAAIPGATAIGCALALDPPLDTPSAALGAALVAGSAWFAWRPRALALVLLCAATALGHGGRLVLVRPIESIRLGSTLVERLREQTKDGSRFALTGFRVRMLPSNQEGWLGLASIHTYNSLASSAYRDWVERISALGMRLHHTGGWEEDEGPPIAGDYGRRFRRVEPGNGLHEPELSFAGVSVLISDGTHDPAIAEPGAAAVSALVRTREPPILEAQLLACEEVDGGLRVAGSLRDAARVACVRELDRADLLRFGVEARAEPSWLFVSQQHHPSWHAHDQSGRALRVLPVNDLYLGVELPADTSAVELRFLPHARHAWIPQALFALCAVILVVQRAIRVLARSTGHGPAPPEPAR